MCTKLMFLISKSQQCKKKNSSYTSSGCDLIFQSYILKLLVLAKRFPVISSKINTMEHYMGLQSKKKNYFFICDDIIELQMFQGCQNWSWISQGVLGNTHERYFLSFYHTKIANNIQLIPVPGWSTRNFNSGMGR